jgi:hypothetical protein
MPMISLFSSFWKLLLSSLESRVVHEARPRTIQSHPCKRRTGACNGYASDFKDAGAPPAKLAPAESFKLIANNTASIHMPIWKLAPILTSASDSAWEFTRWHGPVLVRAGSSMRARQIASEAFSKDQEHRNEPGNTSLMSPWLSDGLVACRRVPVSTYSPEGPDIVLQPHVIDFRQP